MNRASIAVRTITTEVDPINSSRVDQETFPSSILTSLIKPVILSSAFISIYQGRRDLNPQDGIWSLAVCH
jgi:hypothetical protein